MTGTMRLVRGLAGLACVASFAVACGNPAVDPNATFEAQGSVVGGDGQPLANAEVRLIKYSSDTNLFAPSTEDLFSDSPASDPDIALTVGVVKTVMTGADGTFKMEFTGAEIAAPGGYTTGDGLVEVATTVIVVRDPSPMNAEKRAGVYTYSYVFQQANKIWGTGKLNMWDPQATADTSRALTHGFVDFSWKKLDRLRTTDVKNGYRVDIGAPNSPARLIIRCSEGTEIEGGCAMDAMDSTRLTRALSAYSLQSYYSDANGMFAAYVQANGADFRYVARFTITAPIPTIPRDPVSLQGVWAVGSGADQSLAGTKAVDGNPATREAITNNATAIYVQLALGSITDAGLLNTLVKDASKGCVVLEFTVNDYASIEAAKGSTSGWEQKGKFCGENGGKGEVSAIAAFESNAQVNGVTAAWMRLRAVGDTAASNPQFQSVGEVAVYKKSM